MFSNKDYQRDVDYGWIGSSLKIYRGIQTLSHARTKSQRGNNAWIPVLWRLWHFVYRKTVKHNILEVLKEKKSLLILSDSPTVRSNNSTSYFTNAIPAPQNCVTLDKSHNCSGSLISQLENEGLNHRIHKVFCSPNISGISINQSVKLVH